MEWGLKLAFFTFAELAAKKAPVYRILPFTCQNSDMVTQRICYKPTSRDGYRIVTVPGRAHKNEDIS